MLGYRISRQVLLTIIMVSFYPDVKIQADREDYRLPTYITPIRYDINLKINNVAKNWNISTSFDGKVKITFRISNGKKKEDPIILNSKYLVIEEAVLDTYLVEYTVDEELERVTLSDDKESDNNAHILTITYSGMLNKAMQGLFCNFYGHPDPSYRETYWYIATQMAPVYARYVFPCFDEPGFKAVFQLTITYPKIFKIAFSNTDIASNETIDNSTTTKFKETPKMSPHLLAFALFEYIDVDDAHTAYGISYKIGFRPQFQHAYEYALRRSYSIIREYEDITGISYKEAANEKIIKVDQIGIPRFVQGAMENWGLILYREQMLFWNKQESSAEAKRMVATKITHKLGQTWFGNLKTPEWWNVTWISQGFATFYQFHVLEKLETNWELENQLASEIVQVMRDDFTSSRSLTFLEDVVLESTNIAMELDSTYDIITPIKGAAIIRMMRMFMGKDIFNRGVKEFMSKKRSNVVTPQYLWDSWKNDKELNDILPQPLSEIMQGWTDKQGLPVITVRIKGKQVKISTEGIDEPESKSFNESVWYIPITYTTSKSPNFWDLVPEKSNWLVGSEVVLLDEDLSSTDSWIVVNLQCSAYMRVNYDRTLWKRLEMQLRRNHREIHVLNRVQIIDDLINLAIVEQVPFSRVFRVLSYLRYEVDYFPWYTAINGFDSLKQRLQDREVDTINAYLRTLFTNFYTSISNSSDYMDSLKRMLAYKAACAMKNSNCINQMTHIFIEFTKGSIKNLDPNLKFAVYCTGLRSNYGKQLWDVWFQEMIQTRIPSEEIIIADALGCTENMNTLKRYIGKLFDEYSPLKPHNSEDVKRVLSAVTKNARNGPVALMEFLQENAKVAASASRFMMDSILTLALSIRSKEQLEEMRSLADKPEMKDFTMLFDAYMVLSKVSVKLGQTLKKIFIKPLRARMKRKRKTGAKAAASKTYYFFPLLLLSLEFL